MNEKSANGARTVRALGPQGQHREIDVSDILDDMPALTILEYPGTGTGPPRVVATVVLNEVGAKKLAALIAPAGQREG